MSISAERHLHGVKTGYLFHDEDRCLNCPTPCYAWVSCRLLTMTGAVATLAALQG